MGRRGAALFLVDERGGRGFGRARRISTPLDRRGRRKLSIETAGYSGGFKPKSSGWSNGWWEEEWEDADVDSVG